MEDILEDLKEGRVLHSEQSVIYDEWLNSGKNRFRVEIHKTSAETRFGESLPVVVGLLEQKEGEKLADIYLFDNEGVLLFHKSKRYSRGLCEEEENMSLDRLVENGEMIQHMIGNDSRIPTYLSREPIFCSLRANTVGRK